MVFQQCKCAIRLTVHTNQLPLLMLSSFMKFEVPKQGLTWPNYSQIILQSMTTIKHVISKRLSIWGMETLLIQHNHNQI
jgi:hypothetical protein